MRVVAAAVVFCVLAVPVEAQIGAGTLSGRLTDHAADPVPGAVITVTDASAARSRVVATDSAGNYAVPALPPGTYQLRVELNGFKTLVRDGVRIATGEDVRLDLQVEVGSVTEAVTVRADAPLLRSGTSGLGHVIDNQRIVQLPLNGRSFIALGLRAGTGVHDRHELPQPGPRAGVR
jgi:hypothetical protein